jgi:hypothetical protein
VTAGLHHEPTPPAPITTVNIEQLVSNKVVIVKLTSGETLIGAMFQSTDIGLNLTNPYEINIRTFEFDGQWKEVPVLEVHCPYAKNRVFFLTWSNIIYMKEATENYAQIYLEEFARCEHNAYIQLLVNYRNHIEAKQTVKAVALIGDSMIRMDGDKIFIEGNETKH